MMRWASASAIGPDLPALLDKTLGEALGGLAGLRVDAAFVFVGEAHLLEAETVRRRLRAAVGAAPILGCGAGGVVGGEREYEHAQGLSVTLAHLPDVVVTAFHVKDVVPGAPDPGAAGTTPRVPNPDAPPAAWHAALGVPPSPVPAFVLIADPYTIRPEAFVSGLDFAWPSSVKVGGLASAGRGPGDQVLFVGDAIVRYGAVGLALSGDVEVAPAVAQGCRAFGPVLKVTACEGNLLRELDGEPAIEVVRRALGQAAEHDRELARTSALFLGFETDPFAVGEGAWLVRNLLGRERDGTGIYVGEPLRPGRRVRLHVRDRVTSAEDLDRTLASALDGPGAGCAGALLFSCLGRGMHLYGVPDHDTRAFHAHFRGVPLGGFFCSGEIGPVGGSTHLHGFTSSFGLFRPRTRR